MYHDSSGSGGAWTPSFVSSVHHQGRPTAAQAGFQDFFISSRLTGYRGGDTNETNDGLHEVFDFEIVLTRKISHVPAHLVRNKIINVLDGMDPVKPDTLYHMARSLQILFHNSAYFMRHVNNNNVTTPPLLTGGFFFRPPDWKSTSPEPEIRGADWCDGLSSKEGNGLSFAVVRINFTGMERIQCSATGEIY